MRRSKVKMEETCRRTKVYSLLKRIGKDPDNAFEASIDATLLPDAGGGLSFYTHSDRFRHVGIESGDLIVINSSLTETVEKNAIICSVVTDDRDFDDYLVCDFEADHGTDDVLDVEYLYPDEAEGPKRRAKKGDSPQLKRHIVGVVTHVIREAKNLKGGI